MYSTLWALLSGDRVPNVSKIGIDSALGYCIEVRLFRGNILQENIAYSFWYEADLWKPKELFPWKIRVWGTRRPGMASEATGEFLSGYW